MKTFQVTLPDEDAALVEKMLQDGPWESIDELFLNSIGTLQEDVLAEEAMNLDYDEVKRKLEEGIASLERGESVDGEEYFATLLQRLESTEAAPVL